MTDWVKIYHLVLLAQCGADCAGIDIGRDRDFSCAELHLRAARDALREAVELLEKDHE